MVHHHVQFQKHQHILMHTAILGLVIYIAYELFTKSIQKPHNKLYQALIATLLVCLTFPFAI